MRTRRRDKSWTSTDEGWRSKILWAGGAPHPGISVEWMTRRTRLAATLHGLTTDAEMANAGAVVNLTKLSLHSFNCIQALENHSSLPYR